MMAPVRVPLVLLAAFLSSYGLARGQRSPYIPAATVEGMLTAFPASGTPVSILAPGAPVAWAENGRSIFSAGGPRGIEKIDLVSGKTSIVEGSGALWGITDLAVTQNLDRIVTCSRLGDFRRSQWAIVSFSLGEQVIRSFFPHPLNDSRWKAVTLSPDGTRALSILTSMVQPPPDRDHRTELKLIDLETGAAKSLGFNYLSAAWSPDGRWIAALRGADGGGSYLVLLDPVHFRVKRFLGSILDGEINWSPDSRKLIVTKGLAACGPYFATLFSLDVTTGKAEEIKGSRCILGAQGAVGWISADVYQAALARAPSKPDPTK